MDWPLDNHLAVEMSEVEVSAISSLVIMENCYEKS